MATALYNENRWLADRDWADSRQAFDQGYTFGRSEAEQEQMIMLDDQYEADMARKSEQASEAIKVMNLAINDLQQMTRNLDYRSPEYATVAKAIAAMLAGCQTITEVGK